MYLGTYVDNLLRNAVVPNPLEEFLRNVLDVVWTDWFEVGPNGFEIDPEAYEALPPWVKSLVQSLEPCGDRLRVTVVRKEWALKVAAELTGC